MKIKVGITGQSGFIGTHLHNFLNFICNEFEIINFKDEYFNDKSSLNKFVSECDTIIHLAAMNRTKGEPDEIYECNLRLVKELINSCEAVNKIPHIIFSSSLQEDFDNPYGKSKKEGRNLLKLWSTNRGAKFTGLIIPNVFGPFGIPYYNSVISTFSYQITHDIQPKIDIDANLGLIYINDLVKIFLKAINGIIVGDEYRVEPKTFIKVSEILERLNYFKETYINDNIIPVLNSEFEISLFNTFRSYLDFDFYPVKLKINADGRGFLFETVRTYTAGQVFYSFTKPGIIRGNHFHTRKIERFCVIEGEAVIRLRKIGTEAVKEYHVNGFEPSFIDIPVFYTHNIENTGSRELKTLFWTNEIFNPEDPDTYFQNVI